MVLGEGDTMMYMNLRSSNYCPFKCNTWMTITVQLVLLNIHTENWNSAVNRGSISELREYWKGGRGGKINMVEGNKQKKKEREIWWSV